MKKNLNNFIFKSFIVFASVLGIVFISKIFIFSDNYDKEDFENEFSKRYAVYSVEIPEHLEFAGETVPLEYFDVKESVDNELVINTYLQSSTIMIIKRMERFFPVIEPILKKNNIPDDFKYVAVIESALKNVVSPSGAKGYWQFLPATAKEYKLEINDDVDERYDVEKATQAACEYFNEAYAIFNNWTLVAASYNMGKGGVARQIRNQKIDNYYNLHLNEETARYVYRIIALKLILSSPEKFGFHVPKQHRYPVLKYDTLSTDTTITSLSEFALKNNTNYKMLKLYNPWLRNTSLNVKNKRYIFKIPTKDFREKNYFDPKVERN